MNNGVEIYIDSMALPVNPEQIKYSLPDESERFRVLGLGDVEILQGAKLSEVQISGVFPHFEDPYVAEGFLPPSEYNEKLQKLITDKTPVRFVYTGVSCDINMVCSIHDFEITEKGGDVGAWHYSLTARKWVDPKAKRVEFATKNGSGKVESGGKPRTHTQAEKPADTSASTYTVKSGDSLSRIAKNVLGDSSRWREIYELNKDTVKNPNLIYDGQTLKLPSGAATASNSSGGSKPKTKSKSSSKQSAAKSNSTANTKYNSASSTSTFYSSSGDTHGGRGGSFYNNSGNAHSGRGGSF